jgi:hypothetical protein
VPLAMFRSAISGIGYAHGVQQNKKMPTGNPADFHHFGSDAMDMDACGPSTRALPRHTHFRLFSSLTRSQQSSPTLPAAAPASITRARAAALRGGCSGKDGSGGRRKPAAHRVGDIRAASGASAAEEGGRQLPGSHARVVQETVEDPICQVLSGQLIPVALLVCVRPWH